MSEDPKKQPVVDQTPAPASPGATVDDARNDGTDLESLLSQFEAQTTKTEPVSPPPAAQQQPQTTQPDPSVARLVNRIERQDIGNLVKEVKGDLDYDDDIVEAWIDAQARKDVRLQRAWLERDTNPQAFQKIGRELGKQFAKRAAKAPDRALTEDRDAVAAAVRGASTIRAPESAPPSYGTQSNAEFRNDVRQRYGFDPGV